MKPQKDGSKNNRHLSAQIIAYILINIIMIKHLIRLLAHKNIHDVNKEVAQLVRAAARGTEACKVLGANPAAVY